MLAFSATYTVTLLRQFWIITTEEVNDNVFNVNFAVG